MLQNPRLGAPAFQYLHFGLSYRWPDGWSLSVAGKREGSSVYETESYEALEVFELADLVQTVLELRLGL